MVALKVFSSQNCILARFRATPYPPPVRYKYLVLEKLKEANIIKKKNHHQEAS